MGARLASDPEQEEVVDAQADEARRAEIEEAVKAPSPGVRRDHGRLRHFDYVKPLRKPRRRTDDRRRNGQGVRTRKIRLTFMRIVELLPSGLERVSDHYAAALRAILEDVL